MQKLKSLEAVHTHTHTHRFYCLDKISKAICYAKDKRDIRNKDRPY